MSQYVKPQNLRRIYFVFVMTVYFNIHFNEALLCYSKVIEY